jgi:hypothetical protein
MRQGSSLRQANEVVCVAKVKSIADWKRRSGQTRQFGVKQQRSVMHAEAIVAR